jgi:hypothetical protein
MTPRFFSELAEDGGPLIDLLIVDEAGQVSPEIGAASFALSKRALVVGDTMQLEPIWSIQPHVDEQNLRHCGLLRKGDKTERNALRRRGLMASNGNLMLLGQSACPIIDRNMHGVFLAEHRRSVPEIISYCNKLAYGGRLFPKRGSISNRILPAFGYGHVPGSSRRIGTSLENEAEAWVISQWLKANQKVIEEYYSKKPLEELIAIITPFAAQRRGLEKLLRNTFPRMTIGTVHALQGAERRIVIFSSVYDQFDANDYFFDRGKNMLNVAVSRAQDSFLVFGDIAIFNPEKNSASGLLARYLFRDPENNSLPNVELPTREGFIEEQIDRLSSLAQHREALRYAITNAKKRIIIASPQISEVALLADQLPECIAAARKRGTEVIVYTDARLDLDRKTLELRPQAASGRELLTKAGAVLLIADGIHNKTLLIDESELIEGSFNWFSAVRVASHVYQRQETSIRYRGENAAKEIRKTIELLDHRVSINKDKKGDVSH